MGTFAALVQYWTSPIPIAVLSAHVAVLFGLGVLYLARPRDHLLRRRLLVGAYAADGSSWVFVGASFLLCFAWSERLEYGPTAVKLVVFLSVAGGLVAALGVAGVLFLSPTARAAHFAQLGMDRPASPSRTGLPEIIMLDDPATFAVSSSLYGPVILTSAALRDRLTPDEFSAVLAHEQAHIVNRDSRRRMASAVLAKCMFFDPLSKVLHRALDREAEYLADDRAAMDPSTAAALASALRKLGEPDGERPGPAGGALGPPDGR
ncbi:MAG: M56 family metallopeptidase, partial [Methanobacteriota archaeon]